MRFFKSNKTLQEEAKEVINAINELGRAIGEAIGFYKILDDLLREMKKISKIRIEKFNDGGLCNKPYFENDYPETIHPVLPGEKIIGVATDTPFIVVKVESGKGSKITETPTSSTKFKPIKTNLGWNCDARFDCPSCGKGISVHIEKKIELTLIWTTKKPTIPGWYWFKADEKDLNIEDGEIEIVRIDDELSVFRTYGDHSSSINWYSGSWYGPLVVPK